MSAGVFYTTVALGVRHLVFRWKFPLFLATLIALGFGLRIWQLGEQSFWIDEVWHARAAVTAMIGGDGFKSAYDLYPRSPLVTSVTLFSFSALGIGEFAGRLPSVVVGAALILLVYALVRSFFVDRQIALYCAFIVAVDPWLIGTSRELREYVYLILIYGILLYSYVQMVRRRRVQFVIIFGIAVVFAVLTQLYVLIAIPIIVMDLIFTHKARLLHTIKRHYLLASFSASGILLIVALPLYFVISQNAWIFRSQSAFPVYYYAQILFVHEWLYLPFFIAGFYFIARRAERFHLFLLGSFVIPFILLSGAPLRADRFMTFIYPLFLIAVSFGAVEFIKQLRIRTAPKPLLYLSYFLLLALPITHLASYDNWPGEDMGNDIEKTVVALQQGKPSLDWPTVNFTGELVRDVLFIHPNWRDAIADLQPQNRDVVITGSSATGKYYLARNNLRSTIVQRHPFVELEQLKQEISERGFGDLWVIIGHRLYTKVEEIDPGFRNFVLQDMQLIQEYRGLRVYKTTNELLLKSG